MRFVRMYIVDFIEYIFRIEKYYIKHLDIFRSRRTNCIESDNSWVVVLRPEKIENFLYHT